METENLSYVYQFEHNNISDDIIHFYAFKCLINAQGEYVSSPEPVTFKDMILELASTNNNTFRSHMINIFQSVSGNYRWELPPISINTLDLNFEMVLVEHSLKTWRSDDNSFKQYTERDPEKGVCSFRSIKQTTLLIAPTYQRIKAKGFTRKDYIHLSNFMKSSRDEQKHQVLQYLGEKLYNYFNNPEHQEIEIWVNTQGDEVHWLHIRLDKKSLFIHHDLYRASRISSRSSCYKQYTWDEICPADSYETCPTLASGQICELFHICPVMRNGGRCQGNCFYGHYCIFNWKPHGCRDPTKCRFIHIEPPRMIQHEEF